MLISIITVNYNNDKGLLKTINSVKKQTYQNIEFIVIDGDSSDNSKNIIKDNQDIITKCIIEKDNGIYDAMNKGIKLATGDFVIFLNSGDVFYNENVLNIFVKNIKDKHKVYFGRAKSKYKTQSWLYPSKNISFDEINTWILSNEPNHQTMFFPKNFYSKNRYNLSYKIMADADYKHRAINECGYVFIDFIVTIFELGGISSNPSKFKNIIIQIYDRIRIDIKYRKNYKTIIVTPMKFFTKYLLNKLGYHNYLKILKKLKGYK
jgi:putative colanic acid biosynthesis glycosyltransferase